MNTQGPSLKNVLAIHVWGLCEQPGIKEQTMSLLTYIFLMLNIFSIELNHTTIEEKEKKYSYGVQWQTHKTDKILLCLKQQYTFLERKIAK